MDILQYSVIKEQSDISSCLVSLPAQTSTTNNCTVGLLSGRWYEWGSLARTFICPAIWYCAVPCAPSNVVTTPGASNSLCVRDGGTLGTFGQCGVCCLWTVPTGASVARFQIWGAGAGNIASCCCAGSPFGTTGAYGSTIIPVQPGWTYTLCAGCARCGFNCRGTCDMSGCSSFISGCGLTNFCAEGGCANIGWWIRVAVNGCSTCTLTTTTCTTTGGCWCNGCFDYCMQSCATCGKIPFLYAINGVYGSIISGTCAAAAGSVITGINGIYRQFCFDSNHFGQETHPPIFGFDTTSQCTSTWTSGSCGGNCCAWNQGFLQIPSAGGWGVHLMGGTTDKCGDMGRGGMVCVTWW